ncbi:MAG: ATP-binding cassette domain-containing protein [Oscillospiraceae bacterium]|jgi:ABC-2 type transport system ATP-binding protein|nr:ATP-binding cassette domain-containing protein [Oscillospiraceae bacterium]
MNPILEFEKVKKSYGTKQVLCDIDFSVEQGEICGLVGANGVGKTTMMRLAVSLIAPNHGAIRLNLHKKGNVGVLIDYPVLDLGLTVRQNLEAHRRLCGCESTVVKEVIDLLSLKDYADKRVKHLSLGMKQKTALAQAFMGSPELVILDEPVNGLDPQGVRDIREIIVKLNREAGTTFLISSHIIDELVKVVSRCAVLKDGQISFVEADTVKIEEAFFERTGR